MIVQIIVFITCATYPANILSCIARCHL